MEHHGKFVGYLRVSTKKQGADGLGISAQRTAVQQYLNGGEWELIKEFIETESGKSHVNRPKLEEALRLCRITGATLIVAKLDRLSRDVEFLAGLQKGNVAFVACDNPHITPLTVHILAAVAQDERERISGRIKAALAEIRSGRRPMRSKPSTRADGWVKTKLGPPPEAAAGLARSQPKATKLAQVVRNKIADDYVRDVQPVIEDIRASGITSHRAIAKELTRRRIKTPRGLTQWYPATVTNAVNRIEKITTN